MLLPLEEERNYERRLLPEAEEKDEALYTMNDEVHNNFLASSSSATSVKRGWGLGFAASPPKFKQNKIMLNGLLYYICNHEPPPEDYRK
jgi:hypothetical protein